MHFSEVIFQIAYVYQDIHQLSSAIPSNSLPGRDIRLTGLEFLNDIYICHPLDNSFQRRFR